MPKWSVQKESDAKCAKARGSQLRVHFKNCREVGAAIKGMKLTKAQGYLEDVLKHKQAIPFRRFAGGCGRHAQGKNLKAPGSQVGWPEKATRYFIDLLKNAAANAEVRARLGGSCLCLACARAPHGCACSALCACMCTVGTGSALTLPPLSPPAAHDSPTPPTSTSW